jgi:Mrp family chromosome partitioning ATPase/capsular polysaccharide biosynthesis protein
MPLSSTRPLSPSIISALSRFRRVVIVSMAIFVFAFALYSLLSGPRYAGKAAIVISAPPSALHPFFGNGGSTSPAAYVEKQVALLESQPVSNGAANIVNEKIGSAHISGQEINAHLTVKPQTGVASGLNPTTDITVTNGDAVIAAASANAVVQSYTNASHLQIRQQAAQSIAAIDKQITATQSELNQLPAVGSSHTTTTTTTTTHPPKVPTTPALHTTTTRPPRTTTTRPPRTTTTLPPRTTTTSSTTPTTTIASTTGAVRVGSQKALAEYQLVTAHGSESIDLVDTTATTTPGTGTTTTIAGGTGNTGSGSSSNSGTSGTSSLAQRAALTNSLILLNKSKTQVKVDEQADLQYSMVVYPATIPTKPTNGSFWKYIGIGLFLGLAVGIIIAYALAYSRQVFEKPEEPELLYDVPILAAIPAFRQPVWLPTGLPILTEPFDEPAEKYRAIATTLRSLRNSHMSMLVAVSAAAPRSGTTTTVANTGFALAEMGERVLVVDGDPVGRGLTRTLLETDAERPMTKLHAGFSEVLGGRALMETVVQSGSNANLFVLGSGLDPDLALTRWSSQAIKLALNDAKDHFDLVLIDVAPVGTSFGIDLARAAQNLLLVVPYLDPVRYHTHLKDRLEIADIALLGYVFNGVPAGGEFIPYYPLLHSTGGELPEAGPAPLFSSAAAIGGGGGSGAAMAGETYMSAGATTATATAVRDSPRPEHEAEDNDRDDVTLVVPVVPGRPEPETSSPKDAVTLQVLREPITQEQPAVTSEPTTQDVSADDDSHPL